MHGRTARASIDECAQRATSTRPGCRAFGRSRRYGLSRSVWARVASVSVARGGVPSGPDDNVASSDGPASRTVCAHAEPK
jgi:hypothetical protein